MPSFKEQIGQEVYNLLYSCKDKYGCELDDFDDLIYCEAEDIPLERMEKLKALISYGAEDKEVVIAFEAAKLLCAWGQKEGVEYMNYFMKEYYGALNKVGTLSHHRLHGYDTTIEELEGAVMHYQARWSDSKEGSDLSLSPKVKNILDAILSRANSYDHNLLGFLLNIQTGGWHCFDEKLKSYMIACLEKEEQSRNDYWNTIDLKLFFIKHDPEFLSVIEKKYGVVQIPENAKNRL